eukprot:scaffold27296_cov19-Tisochrysis_lutea.AAC.1
MVLPRALCLSLRAKTGALSQLRAGFTDFLAMLAMHPLLRFKDAQQKFGPSKWRLCQSCADGYFRAFDNCMECISPAGNIIGML